MGRRGSVPRQTPGGHLSLSGTKSTSRKGSRRQSQLSSNSILLKRKKVINYNINKIFIYIKYISLIDARAMEFFLSLLKSIQPFGKNILDEQNIQQSQQTCLEKILTSEYYNPLYFTFIYKDNKGN